MKMICEGYGVCHNKPGCTVQDQPHEHSGSCYQPCMGFKCVPYNESQPLINIPGVSYDKEECYLIPVKDIEDFGGSCAMGLNVMWLYRGGK